jgi:hypothetical protein
MIYLKPFESLREKNASCFVRLLKQQGAVGYSGYTVMGLIEEHEVDEINCSNSKKAVYLNLSSGVLNIGGEVIKKEPVDWQ